MWPSLAARRSAAKQVVRKELRCLSNLVYVVNWVEISSALLLCVFGWRTNGVLFFFVFSLQIAVASAFNGGPRTIWSDFTLIFVPCQSYLGMTRSENGKFFPKTFIAYNKIRSLVLFTVVVYASASYDEMPYGGLDNACCAGCSDDDACAANGVPRFASCSDIDATNYAHCTQSEPLWRSGNCDFYLAACDYYVKSDYRESSETYSISESVKFLLNAFMYSPIVAAVLHAGCSCCCCCFDPTPKQGIQDAVRAAAIEIDRKVADREMKMETADRAMLMFTSVMFYISLLLDPISVWSFASTGNPSFAITLACIFGLTCLREFYRHGVLIVAKEARESLDRGLETDQWIMSMHEEQNIEAVLSLMLKFYGMPYVTKSAWATWQIVLTVLLNIRGVATASYISTHLNVDAAEEDHDQFVSDEEDSQELSTFGSLVSESA